MTGIEINNFYNKDKEIYNLKKNKEFLNWLKVQNKRGLNPKIDKEEMQDLINQAKNFYEFKYSNSFLNHVLYSKNPHTQDFDASKISKSLTFDHFFYILSFDKQEFLNCYYPYNTEIIDLKEEYPFPKKRLLSVNDEGYIQNGDLKYLQKRVLLPQGLEKIKVEELEGILKENPQNINYSGLTKTKEQHSFDIQLREEILSFIPFALLYSESTNPYNGFIRIKSFIRSVNKKYNLNLTYEMFEEILNLDYHTKPVIPEHLKHVLKK